MPEISLCIIVKDEADYLAGCLESAKDVVDEIIVVDTGSTDNTKEIARQFGAKIFDFTWVNDFSAARNFSLSKATKDWILYLDADERLTEKSKEIINELKFKLRKAGYYCKVVSPSASTGNPSVMKYIRFFRNLQSPKFSGKVHEQIIPDLQKKGFELLDSGIEILHIGYDVDKSKLQSKARRNLELLLNDYKENPSTYNAFQLGQSYIFLNENELADKYFKIVAERKDLDNEHLAQTYRYLAAFALSQQRFDEAEKLAEVGLGYSLTSPLLNIVIANIKMEKEEFGEASKYVKKAYENNLLYLQGKKRSGFEVLLDEEKMFLYAINASLICADKELFNYLSRKLGLLKIKRDDLQILRFYNSLFNLKGKTLNEIIEKRNFPADKIDPRIFLKVLQNISYDEKKNILKIIVETKPELIQSVLPYVESVEAKSPVTAEVYYEVICEKESNNLIAIFKLVELYFNSGKLEKLKSFLEKTLPSVRENNQIYSRLLAIYDKL